MLNAHKEYYLVKRMQNPKYSLGLKKWSTVCVTNVKNSVYKCSMSYVLVYMH